MASRTKTDFHKHYPLTYLPLVLLGTPTVSIIKWNIILPLFSSWIFLILPTVWYPALPAIFNWDLTQRISTNLSPTVTQSSHSEHFWSFIQTKRFLSQTCKSAIDVAKNTGCHIIFANLFYNLIVKPWTWIIYDYELWLCRHLLYQFVLEIHTYITKCSRTWYFFQSFKSGKKLIFSLQFV